MNNISSIDPQEWVTVASERRPNKPGLTPWFSGSEAPPMPGWYERHFTDSMTIGDSTMQWWDGKYWRSSPAAPPHWRQRFDYPAWRGMVSNLALMRFRRQFAEAIVGGAVRRRAPARATRVFFLNAAKREA